MQRRPVRRRNRPSDDDPVPFHARTPLDDRPGAGVVADSEPVASARGRLRSTNSQIRHRRFGCSGSKPMHSSAGPTVRRESRAKVRCSVRCPNRWSRSQFACTPRRTRHTCRICEHAARTLSRCGGEREIDLIVERGDGRVVALEVKLSAAVVDADVRHLHWLVDRLGDELLDAVVVTTGPESYRRSDGIAVVPAEVIAP